MDLNFAYDNLDQLLNKPVPPPQEAPAPAPAPSMYEKMVCSSRNNYVPGEDYNKCVLESSQACIEFNRFFLMNETLKNLTYNDGIIYFDINRLHEVEIELQELIQTNVETSSPNRTTYLVNDFYRFNPSAEMVSFINGSKEIKDSLEAKKKEFEKGIKELIEALGIRSVQDPNVAFIKAHFSRLGTVSFDLPPSADTPFSIISELVWRKLLFSSVINLDKLGFGPHTFPNPIIPFQLVFELYFRRRCGKNHPFFYKLCNMLKITSYYPEFYSILGVIWVSNQFFKVDRQTFGKTINNNSSNSALFNNSGMFIQHGFTEVQEQSLCNIDPKYLTDVDFNKVRILVDTKGAFTKFYIPQFSEYSFNKDGKQY